MKPTPHFSLIKPSTQVFIKEAKKSPGFSLFDFIHGYVYARWPYLYISIGTGEHPLARAFGPLAGRLIGLFSAHKAGKTATGRDERVSLADTYHGKTIPLETARLLVTIREPIRIADLEQVIPYKRARSILLENPDHIVALECPCRSARAHPCLPLDVCLIIGEPFASFTLEHHPQRSRSISQEEAMEILRAEDERGHVHHAFFKDAMLGRFYAICNCCACCCGAIQAHQHGTPMLASSGFTAHVDEDLCLGCGDCTPFCQFGALSILDNVNHVDEAACMGCGICVSKCGQEAITLQRDPAKGQPLEIYALGK